MDDIVVYSCFECPFYSVDSEQPVANCSVLGHGGMAGPPVRGIDSPRVYERCPLRNGIAVVRLSDGAKRRL